MEPLFIDLETRSLLDLKATGVHRYAEDPSTEVLCARWAVGTSPDAPCREWLIGQPPPADLIAYIQAGGTLIAHNAEFERTLFRRVLAPRLGWSDPANDQWVCTAAMAAAMALPRSLDMVAAALGVPVRKDAEGATLMRNMCKPRRPRKGEAPGVYWHFDPARLARLSEYCAWDVRVTRAIYPYLRPLPPAERASWLLDAEINDRGFHVDLHSVQAAIQVVEEQEARLLAELQTLTGGAIRTAKQIAAMLQWLGDKGCVMDGLDKAAVSAALRRDGLAPQVRRALEIRAELSKSSTCKLEAFRARRCRDGRVKGNLLWHGATTGRWAGVGVQPQNFPRGSLPKGTDISMVLAVARVAGAAGLEAVYRSPMTAVASSLRGLITATPGNVLIAADFSNIEGRLLAWLAGEEWKLDAFRAYDAGQGPDLYVLAYSRSFHVPIEQVGPEERQVGKVQELALGYQGGKGAFQAMAAGYGLTVTDARAEELKRAWRAAHPATVSWWYDLEDAAKQAIRVPGSYVPCRAVSFFCEHGYLWMRLPSGRLLSYPRPFLAEVETLFGRKEVIHFWGVDAFTRKWSPQTTYGGKLAENATQAAARDVMDEAVQRLNNHGYTPILSVHDEIVCDISPAQADIEPFTSLMTTIPAWGAGMPLAAAGWVGNRYRK